MKLTDEQILALERFDPEFRECHSEIHFAGELVAVDTFFVGTLKGVGKVYYRRFSTATGGTPGAALHEQAAAHRGPGPEQRRAAPLRAARDPGEDGAQ